MFDSPREGTAEPVLAGMASRWAVLETSASYRDGGLPSDRPPMCRIELFRRRRAAEVILEPGARAIDVAADQADEASADQVVTRRASADVAGSPLLDSTASVPASSQAQAGRRDTRGASGSGRVAAVPSASEPASPGVAVGLDELLGILARLPEPGELSGLADADDDGALVATVREAERAARMVAAWRDRVVSAAFGEGVARRSPEYAAVASPDRAREWAGREMTAEIATALQMAEGSVTELVHRAEELSTDFPVLADAYARGDVSAGHVRVLQQVLGGHDEDVRARGDAELTQKAGVLTPGKLRVAARRWSARATDAAALAARAVKVRADRHVYLSEADDHMTWLTALLPAVQAEAIFDRLTGIATTARREGDGRTLAQARADALAALLLDDEARAALIATVETVHGAGHGCDVEGDHGSAGAGAPAGAAGAGSGDADPGGADPAGADPGDADPAGADPGGADPAGAGPGGVDAGRALEWVGALEADADGCRTLAGPAADASSIAEPGAPALAGGGCGGMPPRWLAGIKPIVVLTVPVLSLLGHHDHPGAGPAVLEGHGPIDIETARALAAQAPSLIRVLTHPETGAVLSVGRDSYRVPADLRKALLVRDATCRFPGCGRSAVRCDVDHTLEWASGGSTCITCLAHLCSRHHRLRHNTAWKVRQLGDGVLEWTSPFGQVHITEPATHVHQEPASSVLRPPDPPPHRDAERSPHRDLEQSAHRNAERSPHRNAEQSPHRDADPPPF